jgi:hypothetical protein
MQSSCPRSPTPSVWHSPNPPAPRKLLPQPLVQHRSTAILPRSMTAPRARRPFGQATLAKPPLLPPSLKLAAPLTRRKSFPAPFVSAQLDRPAEQPSKAI